MAKIEVKGTIVADDDKWIYEWFGFAATCPKDVHTVIQEANGEDLEVEINSGGGDVVAGNEIYTALRRYKGNVTIIISGMAASAASYIATARRCEISPVGIFMIHNVSGGARGDYHEMDKESKILQTINRSIAMAYIDKTKMNLDDLLDLMDKESWLTAEEALNYGFVDAIIESQEKSQTTSQNSALLQAKNAAAIYNAVTILDRSTIEKTKEMLAKALKYPENAALEERKIAVPESVFNNITQKKEEEAEVMEETGETILTVKDLEAKYPNLVQKIQLEAAEEENKRLKAIDEISGQISEEMVHSAKYGENQLTAKELALAAFKQNGIMAAKALNNLKNDIKDSGANHVETNANAGFAEDSEDIDHDKKVKNLAEKLKRK